MPENKDDIDLKGWDLHRAAEENSMVTTFALIARGDDVNARMGADVNARMGEDLDPQGTHG